MAVPDSSEDVNYKETYRGLKKKLKLLLHENECYQNELKKSKAQLLQATRDRTFLLERLMQYHNVESSASDSDDTDDSEPESKPEPNKSRKKPNDTASESGSQPSASKKKKTTSSQSKTGSQSSGKSVQRSVSVDKTSNKNTSRNRPSIDMSDSSSGFADSLINSR